MKVAEAVVKLNDLMTIELPKDATEAGFGKINEALAEINSRYMTATSLVSRAIAAATDLGSKRNLLKTQMELRQAELMKNDETVKAGKNQGEREALAAAKLKKERLEFEKADIKWHEARAVIQAGENTLAALKASKELASHLLNVTQKEMDLGLITVGSVK